MRYNSHVPVEPSVVVVVVVVVVLSLHSSLAGNSGRLT